MDLATRRFEKGQAHNYTSEAPFSAHPRSPSRSRRVSSAESQRSPWRLASPDVTRRPDEARVARLAPLEDTSRPRREG